MAKIKSGVYVPSVDCDINKTIDGVKPAWNKMKANGYKLSDSPMFCIYHVSPAMTSNTDEYVTKGID